ncbi:hypothetical protein NKH77_50460 [Streptomyces sp. M19]
MVERAAGAAGPWTALALVETTVYRSLRAGAQQLAVIIAGALWASAAMAMTGGSALGSMLIALPVLVLVGNYHRFGVQGLYGATTALLVITYGAYSMDEVGHRLLESLIGAVIGVGVNALVLPPVHLRDVREQLRRLPRDSADLLRTMAGSLREDWSATDAAAWHDQAVRLEQIPGSWPRPGGGPRRAPGPTRLAAAPYRAPPPSGDQDLRWTRIAGHLTAITRVLEGTAGRRRG